MVSAASPLVTVIMPTHDHATTIDLAVASVLNQTLDSLELVIIGDGATPAVREAVVGLPADERVRFIDVPKTPSRAEHIRHLVITESVAPYICYSGDDDILRPDHLADTLERLERVDFTHPLPLYIGRHGQLEFHPTDLANRKCREWHMHPGQNAVSLTGVGHRRESYLKLPYGWRVPPPGVFSDHFMWQQWFAHDGFSYSTGNRLTVLKFEAAVRKDFGHLQRRNEILEWLDRAERPDFETWLAAAAHDAIKRSAIEMRLESSYLHGLLLSERNASTALRQQLLAGQEELSTVHERQTELRKESAEQILQARLAEQQARLAEQEAHERAAQAEESERRIRATKTWRLHDRVVRWLP